MASPETAPAPAPKDGAESSSKTAPETVEAPAPSVEPATATPEVPAVTDDAGVNPLDFAGEVDTNHDLPTADSLREIDDLVVLDAEGKPHTFKSLYTSAPRVLIIFIRHFFCGVRPLFSRILLLPKHRLLTLCVCVCPELPRLPPHHLRVHHPRVSYVPTTPNRNNLTQLITPLVQTLPTPTSLIVIGCGDPSLIPSYQTTTASPCTSNPRSSYPISFISTAFMSILLPHTPLTHQHGESKLTISSSPTLHRPNPRPLPRPRHAAHPGARPAPGIHA